MMKYTPLLLLLGCTETRDAITGTQSLEIELVSPANPGAIDMTLSDTQRTVVVNVRAKDANGQFDSTFSDPVRVYAQFLGTLTPDLDAMPLVTIAMNGGVAMNQTINLPNAFGPTTLWFDNGVGLGAEYQFGAVTGTSPTLWYRDPFIQDLQKPRDEMAVDALAITPLTDKQIRVAQTRHGANGVLVVTSIFAQGYTVSDVACATGLPNPTPPCVAGDYDHAMVFTFSAPRDQYGQPLVEGELIGGFNGGLTEFNGLTEVGFPRTFTLKADRWDGIPGSANEPCPNFPNCSKALIPAPPIVPLDAMGVPLWFGPLSSSTGRINFERNEAGPIQFGTGMPANLVTVCPIDDGPDGVYTKYKQWVVDPKQDPMVSNLCKMGSSADREKLINIITAGTDFTTDPHTLVGKKIPRLAGILRPVNFAGFNVWIVYPRGKDDVQTQ